MRAKTTNLILVLVAGILTFFAMCKTEEGDDKQTQGVVSPVGETDVNKDEQPEEETPPVAVSEAESGPFVFRRRRNKYKQGYFRNPFDSAIYVSGTFCELRGNHFHAGLDIRTGGREGWPVLAVADGYVSRVKVSTRGYGRVIYVTHPNGYVSVYGHLKSFKGKLANYVKEAQYQQRKFEIELYPKKNEIPFKQGQAMALSGNTGGSGGPHLHFEIRDPQGQSTNPLLHGLDVKDRLKPVIKNVSVYLKDDASLQENGNYPYKLYKRDAAELKGGKTINLQPGAYSFGMRFDDYFTDRRNKLGVNYCWLTANGKLLYQYQIERFAFSNGRYIYTHTDPYLKYKTGLTFVRLFKEGFNPLPYYKQNHHGEVNLKHEDSVEMKLFIQDYAGLTDSLTWVVVGDTAGKKLTWVNPVSGEKEVKVGKSGKSMTYKEWSVTVPGKAVYHPYKFKMSELPAKPNMVSKTLQMHYPFVPMHAYASVSYKLNESQKVHGNKLCAVSFSNGKTPYYEGGSVEGGKLKFRTRSLGQYAITHDKKPPTIKPLSVGKNFKFRVRDNLSGVKRIICSIDGKWILAEYEPKTGIVWGEVPAWIKPGSYEFKLIVIDDKSNRAEYKKQLKI